MTTKEVLINARKLIEDPANWKQGGLAEVDQVKQEATGPYCSLGAIGKTLELFGVSGIGGNRTGASWGSPKYKEKNYGDPNVLKIHREAAGLLEECLPVPVHEYNDSHDHECVLAAFDVAIEKAEK